VSSGSTTAQARAKEGALSRYTFAGALAAALLVGVAVALAVGLGHHHASAHRHRHANASAGVALSAGAPSRTPGVAAGRPAASAGTLSGAGASHAARGTAAAQTQAAIGPDGTAAVGEVRDPEEAKSFPVSAAVSARHRSASTPTIAAEAAVAPGAASDAEIRKELRQEEHAKAEERAARARALRPAPSPLGGSSVGGDGTVPIPPDVPEVIQRVIAGGNAIADFPYIWGGGHGSFVDRGYDCSGSVSYALAAGGLLSAPLVSGDLASWGAPGPGRWITIYANAGHTFMNVDGMWFDTAGRSGPYASRWILATPSLVGYAVRHPPGY
jgi:cell wall-associated NlpC family hydrolase